MSKKLTTEEFINRANNKFKNIFDYSLVKYTGIFDKIDIICKKHGLFSPTPNDFLDSKHGCPFCADENQGLAKRLNNEEFIKRCKEKHNNKYDYSLTQYIRSNKKVIIICPFHGSFSQLANSHLNGQGCSKCGLINQGITQSISKEVFLLRANQTHSSLYEYDLTDYKNVTSNIKIKCPIHGWFIQSASNHLYRKQGCPKCKFEKASKRYSFTEEQYHKKALEIYGDSIEIDFSGLKNAKSIVRVNCPTHGWVNISINRLIHNKKGCPLCKETKGEFIIRRFLENNAITFIREKRFVDCKNKNSLPFDFYIPNHNVCIEYDGIQHYKNIKGWREESQLKYIQNNDCIKNWYCLSNNITLIRIPYTEFNNIEKILSKELL